MMSIEIFIEALILIALIDGTTVILPIPVETVKEGFRIILKE